jgi:23S rRNA pseudouridine2605 synthase
MSSQERLQKILAKADFGSRRSCEKIIEQGRVTVNGKVATIGDKANPETDHIKVDGQSITLQNFEKRYYVFHKPQNVLSTNKAPDGDDRSTVRELLPIDGHLFTIGRLDAESEGLMVLTNDGELANKLAHPRYEHTKTYKVTVYGHPTEETIEKWEKGVWLDGKRTAPCYIRVLESSPKVTTLRIIMLEGRKRQIRRIARMLEHPVARLVRTHIGQLGIGTLKKGAWYRLSDEEVSYMSMPADEVKFIRKKNRKPRQYGGKPKIPNQ